MQILFFNSDFVICIKPVGVDSEHALPQLLQQELGGSLYPVHRLDQNVGGIMVYGRTAAAAAALSEQIRSGCFIKEYVAQVHGTPPELGDWTDLLFKDSRKNKVFVVQRQRKGVKQARLSYRLLRAANESLVRIRLYTGRSHQIRVQFASRGYPLCGDRKYGARDSYSAPALYSCCLQFTLKEKSYRFEQLPPWCESCGENM